MSEPGGRMGIEYPGMIVALNYLMDIIKLFIGMLGFWVKWKAGILDYEVQTRRLNDIRILKETMLYRDPFYYKASQSDTQDGPFCATCFDRDNKVIRIPRGAKSTSTLFCRSCKSYYSNPEYARPKVTKFRGTSTSWMST